MINNGVLYRAAVAAEERITQKMRRLRYAQRDVAARGLAYDANAADGREVYLSALEQMGIARDEIAGLTSYDMEKMLRCMPRGGSRNRRSTAMAFDSRACSKLDGILAGAPTPVDLSDR
jgi:hypothetical protein